MARTQFLRKPFAFSQPPNQILLTLRSIRLRHTITPIAISVSFCIFLMISHVSTGWTSGVLYIIPLAFVALWSSSHRYFEVIFIAFLCSVLLSLNFFLSSYWGDPLLAQKFFGVPLAMLWIITTLSLLRKVVRNKDMTRSRVSRICPTCKEVRDEKGVWDMSLYFRHRQGRLLEMMMCRRCAPRADVAILPIQDEPYLRVLGGDAD